MKHKRKYSSIRTIYEKAKTGELEYDNKPSLFGKFDFNKRPEIIKPYLHSIDRNALQASVHSFIINNNNYHEIIELAKKDGKILDPYKLPEQIMRIWQSFPKEVLNDLYNMYYKDIKDLKFEERTNSNKARFSIIEKSNDPVDKVLTKEDNINCMLYTRSIVQYYLAMLAIVQQKDNQEFEKAMKSLTGSGEEGEKGNNKSQQEQQGDSLDESDDKEDSKNPGKGDSLNIDPSDSLAKLQKRFEETAVGKRLENKTQNDARKSVEAMEEMMSSEEREQFWKDIAGAGTSRERDSAQKLLDPKFIKDMQNELKKVTMNMNGVKDKIKRLLDKSVSYFSSKEILYHENIFEASSLDGLEDWILLHPSIRKAFIADIDIRNTKKLGKIDIYVDVSGSMGSSCGVKDEKGRSITKALFAKSLVFKMKELDLLNDVYSFENSVRKRKSTQLGILSLDGNGGTFINGVIENINKTGNNAIVLTDAEDRCTIYSDQAFFIGVEGADFSRFDSQYMENEQVCIFDGKTVSKVNSKGYQIKG